MTAPIRVLQCIDCSSLEVLPPYEGPAEYDDALNYLSEKHRFPDGNSHRGNLIPVTIQTNDGGERPGTMDDWNNPKFQKLVAENFSKATRPGQGTGLGAQYYDARDTFREDAMTCWQKHHRNPDCNDYMDESKRLVPDTKVERKELGLGRPRSNRSLCEFCPVHSLVIQKRRADAGLYK